MHKAVPSGRAQLWIPAGHLANSHSLRGEVYHDQH